MFEFSFGTKLLEIIKTLFIFTSIDFGYLYLMRESMETQIKEVQGKHLQLNLFAATLCYISLILGLWFFIIREKMSILCAFLLGTCIYSVFEFTNLAIFDKWKWQTAIIDILWGGCLFASTTYLVYA